MTRKNIRIPIKATAAKTPTTIPAIAPPSKPPVGEQTFVRQRTEKLWCIQAIPLFIKSIFSLPKKYMNKIRIRS